jgi:hypothetical protein
MPVKKKSSIKLAPVSVRLLPATKAALEKAALADDRPISVMAQKIIADWLKANGFLKWAGRKNALPIWPAITIVLHRLNAGRPAHFLTGRENG